MARTMTPLRTRLIDRMTWMPSGCIEVDGALSSAGYPRIGRGGRGQADHVHRVAYELFVGPIPEGMEVDHVCRNRRCVAHLEVVTPEENKRRHREWVLAQRGGRCPAGHEYRGRRPNGHRRCLDCEAKWQGRRSRS